MPTPAELAALAINPGFALYGRTATYTPPAGAAVPCTVIKSSQDRRLQMDTGRPVIEGTIIEVRASEVAAPIKGGVFAITGGPSLKVVSDPVTEDPDRLVWRCTAR